MFFPKDDAKECTRSTFTHIILSVGIGLGIGVGNGVGCSVVGSQLKRLVRAGSTTSMCLSYFNDIKFLTNFEAQRCELRS